MVVGEDDIKQNDTGEGDAASASFTAESIATGFNNPIFLTSPKNDNRLFVVEKPGRIRIIEYGNVLDNPFLDIQNLVTDGSGEQGMLGLAFHPQYATNQLFYVNYTASEPKGATIIAEYKTDPSNPGSTLSLEKRLLTIEQPFANHNGGMIAFGPDGFLYVGMGDGGGGGDPMGHGQNPKTQLGAILRIDVDNGDPYSIPQDNPFVANLSNAQEIWATGLRNPWRFSFDRATGDLYVGDVGQNAREEIDLIENGMLGANLGWAIKEGTQCFKEPGCDRPDLLDPIYEYEGADRCSVIGGYVYRGKIISSLIGSYIYADFCSDEIFSLVMNDSGDYMSKEISDALTTTENITRISSFGENSVGELFVLSLEGTIYKLVTAQP